MTRQQGDTVYICTESFNCELNGVPTAIHAGKTHAREGHELIVKYRQFFKPLEVEYEVEQATAGPGERRP